MSDEQELWTFHTAPHYNDTTGRREWSIICDAQKAWKLLYQIGLACASTLDLHWPKIMPHTRARLTGYWLKSKRHSQPPA